MNTQIITKFFKLFLTQGSPILRAVNAEDIAQTAVDLGTINPTAAKAASKAVSVAARNTGIGADQISGARVFLVNILVDDSSSMAGTEQMVRDAMRQLKDELILATNEGGCEVLFCIYMLNKGMIQPYCRVEDSVDLTDANHQNDGGTPMMGRGREILGTMLSKISEFADSGRQVLTFTCFISDGEFTDILQPGEGENTSGGKVSISEMNSLIVGLTDKETRANIVCGVSIRGAASATFQAIGIRHKWILNPGDAYAFSEAMKAVSRASRSASKGVNAFKATAAGGFR